MGFDVQLGSFEVQFSQRDASGFRSEKGELVRDDELDTDIH